MRAALAFALLTSLTWAPAAVAAGNPLVLVQDKVTQYHEAADGVRRKLPGAVMVDPADATVPDRLKDAPLVIAVGQKALNLAQRSGGSTPVVFCMVLGSSRGTLGPKVTGVPLEPEPATTFASFRSTYPGLKRLGVIYDPAASDLLMAEVQRVAPQSGLTLVLKPVSNGTLVRDAAKSLAGSVDALWLPPNPQLISKELFTFLLDFCAERKLPLFGFLDSFTEAGALASVSPDYGGIGERAGSLAASILAKPEGARVPVPTAVFAPGNLTLNLRTAKALGVSVPQKAIADARQVYR